MKNFLLPLFLLFAGGVITAQPLISFQTFITGTTQAVDMLEANDGSGIFYIVERTGRIRVWKNAHLLSSAFLDATSLITSAGSEQGLLSLAFHPDYRNNGFFFI